MVSSSMRYVKRNYWSIHGSSLAAFSCPVNVAGRIHRALTESRGLRRRTFVYTLPCAV